MQITLPWQIISYMPVDTPFTCWCQIVSIRKKCESAVIEPYYSWHSKSWTPVCVNYTMYTCTLCIIIAKHSCLRYYTYCTMVKCIICRWCYMLHNSCCTWCYMLHDCYMMLYMLHNSYCTRCHRLHDCYMMLYMLHNSYCTWCYMMHGCYMMLYAA